MRFWWKLKHLLPSIRRSHEHDMKAELEALRDIAGPGELGNLTLAAEDARSIWSWIWLERLGQDLRYAARTLRASPLFASVAVVSLALGIGANTLVFSFINSLLFMSPPYSEPERLVTIGMTPPGSPGGASGLTGADCAALAEAENIYEAFGCFAGPVSGSLDGAESVPERLSGQLVTAGLLRTLGISPLAGRWFAEEEDPGGAILISEGLWRRRFGEDQAVIGRSVRFDGQLVTIVGVMPEAFELVGTDYWMPLGRPAMTLDSPARMFGGVGRLRGGIRVITAQAAMDAVALRRATESPETNQGWGIRLQRFEEDGPSIEGERQILIMQGAAGLVMLIACANVASLLLIQGAVRRKEIAVRTALGSSRARIVHQWLTHALLLGLAGGLLGVAIGGAGVAVMRSVLPGGLPRAVYETELDGTVLAFAFGIALTSGLVSAIVPAFKVSRVSPLDALKASTGNVGDGAGRHKLRSLLVVGEIALAFVLLVGAGLLVHSLIRATDFSPGFDTGSLLTVSTELPDRHFRRPAGAVLPSGALGMETDPAAHFAVDLVRQNLTDIPGVAAASGIAIFPPLSGAFYVRAQVDDNSGRESPPIQFIPILPDYFRTLDVPIFEGREFVRQDTSAGMPVVIVNQAMADTFWPGQNAVGQRIRLDFPVFADDTPREIVGVAGDVKQYLGQDSRPQMYLPYAQLPRVYDERLVNQLRSLTYVLRTRRSLAEVESDIRDAVSRVDRSQAMSIRTMQETAFGTLQRRRVTTSLLGTFGAIAVILAVIGIYGVVAYAVSQRTHEIGIRLALGARPAEIRRLSVRHGSWLVAAGLVSGVGGALAVTRVLRSFLFEVSPTDPFTFSVAVGLLGVIAMAACYLPARRAARVDPMVALRNE